LGVTPTNEGLNVAVSSEIAEAIEVCLFDADGAETRVELPERTAHVWHGLLPDVGPGQKYGLRVHGPWNPAGGLRCNPAKLLIDPYATAIDGEVRWGPEVWTVIYETHVKGLTQRHPDVPEEIRGTYAGLAHPAVTDYLGELGITAVKLLPVHLLLLAR
jgi:glycogen operon protein